MPDSKLDHLKSVRDCDKHSPVFCKPPAAAEPGTDQKQQYDDQAQQDSPQRKQGSQRAVPASPAHALGRLSYKGVSGRTELHMAAEVNDQAKVQQLLQAGADIHAVDSEGLTAVMLAARAGHAETVKDLATAGASVSTADTAGNTALLLAASGSSARHTSTAQYLISKHFTCTAQVQQTNAAGRTPLMAAAAANNAGTVHWLLACGAASSTADSAGYTSLHLAAQGGFLGVADHLLRHAKPQDDTQLQATTVQHKLTALHLAARAGQADMVQLLLCHLPESCKVDAAAADGKTALHLAAQNGHAGAVSKLLLFGADPALSDAQLATPLSLAAQHKHAAVLQQLAQHVASKVASTACPLQADSWRKSWSPLHKATARGHCEVMAALVDSGMPVDFPGVSPRHPSVKSTRVTPLMLAAFNGREAAVQLLLARGTEVSAWDSSHLTALHWAAMSKAGTSTPGRMAILDMLLAAGVPTDAVSKGGDTVLLIAMRNNDIAFAQRLLADMAETAQGHQQQQAAWFVAAEKGMVSLLPAFGGRHVNSYNEAGDAALHLAVTGGHEAAVQKLLAMSASVNMPTLNVSATALHLAARANHVGLCRMLLAAGARLDLGDDDGGKPLHWAAHAGNDDALEVLLQSTAEINARNPDSNYTALHYAVSQGKATTVQLLIALGADQKLRDDSNNTPLDLAAISGRMSCLEILLQQGTVSDLMTAAAKAYDSTSIDYDIKEEVVYKLARKSADVNPVAAATAAAKYAHCQGFTKIFLRAQGDAGQAAHEATVAAAAEATSVQQQRTAVQHLIVSMAGVGKQVRAGLAELQQQREAQQQQQQQQQGD